MKHYMKNLPAHYAVIVRPISVAAQLLGMPCALVRAEVLIDWLRNLQYL